MQDPARAGGSPSRGRRCFLRFGFVPAAPGRRPGRNLGIAPPGSDRGPISSMAGARPGHPGARPLQSLPPAFFPGLSAAHSKASENMWSMPSPRASKALRPASTITGGPLR